MEKDKNLTPEELKERAIRFYNRYGNELEQVRELLQIRLTQLAHAYTINHNLPPEAITVSTRVKSLGSFLKKLEKKGFPQFYLPTEVIQDLIGARVICWFIDDCNGIMDFISSSNHLDVKPESIEDYITNPKPSGYRSIHLQARVAYDSISKAKGSESVEIKNESMLCEVQIRTKIQDAWGDMTHEFHYKAKIVGVENAMLETMLSELSKRLSNEDNSLLTLRDAYQGLIDEKQKSGKRTGFIANPENIV
ncbi:RelA/SpoT domain-containing protein [Vibrio vulnificus]|nr:GTP pyrophosphokinase [Vibrio parahaemolyticus]QBN15604.1 GTP pyrophosphokinase [Vibrio vulnificus]HAS6204097.1 GTP pyrophosphokinase [Vibrio vulnificus]